MKNTKRAERRQQIWVVVVALAIITVSAGTTLYLTGAIGGRSSTQGEPGFRNVTFTDAYLECDSYTRSRYSERIQTLTLDDHSSRYDHEQQVYKIFMKLQMRKPPHAPLPEPYWVNCFVEASDGDITEYQVGEAKNAPVEPVRKERGDGTFGWP